jgi:hypothetical protein
MSALHHEGQIKMGLARRKDMDDDIITVSEEARRRIGSARVRQIAFQIKNIAPDLPDDDAEVLASILLEASAQSTIPTGADLRSRLEKAGLSTQDAERIAGAVGL